MNRFTPISSADQADSITDLLRAAPTVSPGDSIQRFLDMLGYAPFGTLPVIEHDKLIGYVCLAEAVDLLRIDDQHLRQTSLYAPVTTLMNRDVHSIRPSMSRSQVEQLFLVARTDLLAVTDDFGYYLGCIAARDLLLGAHVPVRLPSLSGMATPFGVYLSDGTLQAGASNLALAAGGATIGACITLSMVLIRVSLIGLSRVFHQDLTVYSLDYVAPDGDFIRGSIAVSIHLATTALFLIMIRCSRIAGYHAAEHQTVHAIERGEPLVADVVARMPRPHPRCGTNLMGGAILFVNLMSIGRAFNFDQESAPLLAAVITMMFWRKFGTFLQAVLTTRPASYKELMSGINAAESLATKYRNFPPHRTKIIRRIWCSGMLQSLAGMAPAIGLLAYLLGDWIK